MSAEVRLGEVRLAWVSWVRLGWRMLGEVRLAWGSWVRLGCPG
jgi:hypothetical protein